MRYLLLALVACSSSGAADTDGDGDTSCSSGTINGTIAADAVDHTFGPVVRAFETHSPPEGAPALVLDEQLNPAAPCELLTMTGFNLALVLAAEPTPGTYTSNVTLLGVAEQNGDADLAISTAGTATIDSVTTACVTGSYTLTFGTQGMLSGSFAVMRCL